MRGLQHHSDFALKSRIRLGSSAHAAMKKLMRPPRKQFALLVLLLITSSPFLAQTERPEAEKHRLLSLENAWNQAQWQKDTAALNMLLAPDLIYVEYDGTLMGRSEYISTLLSPTLHPTKIFSDSMNVHLYTGVAVVNGIYTEKGVRNGKAYSVRSRFTDTWIRRGETWVCVASQATLAN